MPTGNLAFCQMTNKKAVNLHTQSSFNRNSCRPLRHISARVPSQWLGWSRHPFCWRRRVHTMSCPCPEDQTAALPSAGQFQDSQTSLAKSITQSGQW